MERLHPLGVTRGKKWRRGGEKEEKATSHSPSQLPPSPNGDRRNKLFSHPFLLASLPLLPLLPSVLFIFSREREKEGGREESAFLPLLSLLDSFDGRRRRRKRGSRRRRNRQFRTRIHPGRISPGLQRDRQTHLYLSDSIISRRPCRVVFVCTE